MCPVRLNYPVRLRCPVRLKLPRAAGAYVSGPNFVSGRKHPGWAGTFRPPVSPPGPVRQARTRLMVATRRGGGDRSRGLPSVRMTISRRAVIAASGVVAAVAGTGGWAVLAENRVVPGRSLIDQALGRCEIPVTVTTAEPGRLVSGFFFSRRRGRSVGYVLAYPPKTPPPARLPVCLVLHGSGADESTAFDGLGYHRLLAEVGASGYVLASVAGGDGYWHQRVLPLRRTRPVSARRRRIRREEADISRLLGRLGSNQDLPHPKCGGLPITPRPTLARIA